MKGFRRNQKSNIHPPSEKVILGTKGAGNKEDTRRETGGWILVLAMAFAFLFYALFMFFTIGDKGPPGWDFGDIADTPGQSAFSTSPEPSGNDAAPSAQHVSEKPVHAPDEKGVSE